MINIKYKKFKKTVKGFLEPTDIFSERIEYPNSNSGKHNNQGRFQCSRTNTYEKRPKSKGR